MSDSTQLTVPERAAIALGTAEHEKRLVELSTKYSDITAIVNPAGREQVHSAYMSLKNARIDIDSIGKAARADANAFRDAVIAEATRLIGILEPEEARLKKLRDNFDEEVAREKAAKAATEKARVDLIRTKIDEIKTLPAECVGRSSIEIQGAIDLLFAHEITLEEFAEFAGEADLAKCASLGKLQDALVAQQAHESEQERIRQERAELERLRAEAAERERVAAAARVEEERQARAARDREAAERQEREIRERVERQRVDGLRERIANIRATVAMQAGKSSASIESAMSALEAMEIDSLEFNEFFAEADSARADAVNRLHDMCLSMKAHEDGQAELKRQQDELIAQRAEADRIERERQEAIEAAERAKREEAEAAERAEAARVEAERQAAEAERIRREREQFETYGPGDVEIVKVLAEYYDVNVGDVMGWMKKFDYEATDEQLAAENARAAA
jgi:hypothetical protein